jgi:hypothetical protein|tara:strand:- start:635 stop:760 length:126 start_codon:yes stop_codon:yes gene_type:complete
MVLEHSSPSGRIARQSVFPSDDDDIFEEEEEDPSLSRTHFS